MGRQRISSGSLYEAMFGYSRAVKVGNQVFVSGTVAIDASGQVIAPGDAYAQTITAFQRIETALAEAGATLADVVRTRVFATDLKRDWEAIAKAHGELFGDVRPASTAVEARLLKSEWLVEIEADAVIS